MGECFISGGGGAASKVVGPAEFKTSGSTIFLPDGKVFSDFARIDGWGYSYSGEDNWTQSFWKSSDTNIRSRMRTWGEHDHPTLSDATTISFGTNLSYIYVVYGVLK